MKIYTLLYFCVYVSKSGPPSTEAYRTHLCEQVLELLVQRDKEFQELMRTALRQGRTHEEMQKLEKEVEKRDGDIQLLQKQLKEAEHILVSLFM